MGKKGNLEVETPFEIDLFNVLVRFVPGTIIAAMIQLLFQNEIISLIDSNIDPSRLSYIETLLFIVFAFAIGTAVRGVAVPLSRFVNWIAFGNKDPRSIYADDTKRGLCGFVIKGNGVREEARKIVASSNMDSRTMFGVMITRIESSGKNGKEDKMLTLSDMASSLAATTVICFLLISICTIWKVPDPFHFIIWLIICSFMTLVFCVLYVRYLRMRYSIIVKYYYILQ